MNIRRDFPKISLATVYRNLSLLADMGEIQKISTPDGPTGLTPGRSPMSISAATAAAA